MITAKDKYLAAIQAAWQHQVLAKACDEPFIRQGHLEVVETFMQIADDYARNQCKEAIPA